MTTPPRLPVDVHGDGLLWLINRVVFHPRGFALGHTPGHDASWVLLGDGSEPWTFSSTDDDALFAAVEATLQRARDHGHEPGN